MAERRRGRRVGVPGGPRGRVRAVVETRLIELSASGARIEHGNLLRPGVACVLELPGSLGGVALAARVVRTIEMGVVVGDAASPTLRYESGLRFEHLSPEQQIVLDGVLERLSLTQSGKRSISLKYSRMSESPPPAPSPHPGGTRGEGGVICDPLSTVRERDSVRRPRSV